MDSFITLINTTGKSFIEFSTSMLIQSSIVIILLLLLDLFLRKKVRAVFLYCIWMLILVKLVLPTTLSSPTGLGYWLGDKVLDIISQKASIPEQTVLDLQNTEPVSETIRYGTGMATVPSASVSQKPVAVVTSAKFTNVAPPAKASFSCQGFAFLGWLAVVTTMVLLLIKRMFFVRSLLAKSKKPNDSVLEIFGQCCKHMGVRRSILLKLSPYATSPSACGFFRPTILIPHELKSILKIEDLKPILLHELAHIKRGDLWISLIQTILQIAYFYNPLLWVANVIIRKVREQAVDETVLVAMGEQAGDYPETLLNISRLTLSRPVISLHSVGIVESKKALYRRIKQMLNRPIPQNAKLGIRGLMMILILGAVLLPMARAQRQSTANTAVDSDAQSKYASETAKVDIAIEDGDFEVIKLSDRLFEATISLRNKGSVPIPQFRVNFCAGDPDKGGRLLSPQQAGPIMPGDTWREYNPGLRLEPGENTISVIVDPDNRVEESDETNNKVLRLISMIGSESEDVDKVEAIQKVDLSGDDILQVEAQASEGFNFPYYLFIPSGIDKSSLVYILVEPNNSGMVSDDPEVHQAKALTLVKRSYANRMARRLGVPLLVPTFPRPRPETHSWAYTHALDIDTLEITEGKLKRVDLQLTAMIKNAQEFLRKNGFAVNDKIFIDGFSASAKFCNRYSYLHPEMVKAAAAGGVNGLPTLPVREWNGYELPFPIGIAGIEKFTGKPFDERAFRQVAQYIYMGSSDKNDTLFSPEAWRKEEADLIRKALAAPKMMPDRWELSRKIYQQQNLHAQLVTYNGVGHSIRSQMLDDVINFFKANSGDKYVPIKPYEYPLIKVEEVRPKDSTGSAKIDIAIKDENLTVTKQPDGSFVAKIDIWNRGSHPFPRFRVDFYAGDPDEGGRLLAPHGAGPIKPGGVWREGTYPHRLQPGENIISVVVDPDNRVEESDETNNKASAVIPGRQPKVSIKPETVSKQNEQKEQEKVVSKASGIDIKPTNFDIRLDKNRGTCDLVVDIQNKNNITIPGFKLRFYRGDPANNLDETGNVQGGWYGAGPIEPGKSWSERTMDFHLPDGQYDFYVVLDCDNNISEIDENNNQAELKVKIENGQIADKSVTRPSNSTNVKPSREPSDSYSKPNMFIISPSNFNMFREIVDMVKDITWNKTGRYHNKKSYDEIFIDEIHNKKPGDILVLLFSLDNPERIPTEYEDLLPKPWPEIEADLKQGQTVELKGKAREMNVILLAAPTNEQLRSLVQESKLLNPSAKPVQSSLPTSGSSATMPNGVTVELLGVCEHPSEGKQWWRPDGSLMKNAPYKSMGSLLKHRDGYNDYEFVMRLTGPSDTSYKWQVPGGTQGSDTGAPIGKDDRQVSDLRVYTANQSQDKKTATVRIGVSAAKWDTLATYTPQDKEETYSLKQGAIAFGTPYEKNGETFLPVVHNFNRGHNVVAIRVIAITHSGQQLGSSCSGSGGNVLSSLTFGFDSALNNIREFQFLTRPYSWVEFKNVSLRPGTKTDVQHMVLEGNTTSDEIPSS